MRNARRYASVTAQLPILLFQPIESAKEVVAPVIVELRCDYFGTAVPARHCLSRNGSEMKGNSL